MKNQTDISEMEGRGRMEVRPHIPIGSRPPATVVYGLIIRLSAESDKGGDTDRKRVSRRKRMEYGTFACLI